MKTVYVSLYAFSLLVLACAILGGTLMRPVFDELSTATLDKAGFRKSYFESADDRIDELVYKSKQIELQIDKLRNFFSGEKTDESKYKKEKGELLGRTFYNPMVSMFDFFYRVIFSFAAVILFCLGLIFNLTERALSLRKRVKMLEEFVYRGSVQ